MAEEDYQMLFQELGGQLDAQGNAVPATPEVNPTNPVAPVNNPAPAGADTGTPADPTNNGEGAGADPQDPTPPGEGEGNPAPTNIDENVQAQARAFAEMRAVNNNYKKVFKQLQSYMGVDSEEAVIAKLTDAGLQAEARKTNTDPEVLKKIQNLEQQNLVMMSEKKRTAVVESFGLLQKTFNLTQQEVMDFAREIDQKKIDLFTSGVDIETLYRGMKHDAIVNKRLEAEKQSWITESAKAEGAPGVLSATGKKSKEGKKEINTQGELDALLNSLTIN